MKTVIHQPASIYAAETLRAASLRAEFVLSIVRVAFCLLIAVRFVSINGLLAVPDAVERGIVNLPPTILAIVFSLVLLSRLPSGRVSDRLLTVSVLADAVVCAVAIGSNVVWPFPGYRGVLLLPETASVLAMVFAAGFRASYRLAVVGALANGIGLAALIALEHAFNPAVAGIAGTNVLSFYVVLFGCSAALSIFGARRTEQLVQAAALHSYKTAQAEHGLTTVLQGHHDALSLISAALFGVEQLKHSGARAADVANLASDLDLLRDAVSRIREEALREMLVLRPPDRVELRAALEGPRETFERIAAPVRVDWQFDSPTGAVLVAGGPLALQRLLSNLLVNAKEGDGRNGATRVRVVASHGKEGLTLSVDDDGPGFPSGDVLESSKEAGTASGLRFVRAVAEASGGKLSTQNTGRGGRVTVVLPLAP